MKWVLLILAILLVIVLLLLITKITVLIYFKHASDDDELKIILKAWGGLFRYTINVPLVKVDIPNKRVVFKEEQLAGNEEKKKVEKTKDVTDENVVHSLKNFREVLIHVLGARKIALKLLRQVRVKRLEWHSLLGTGDAAQTAKLVGVAYTIKGSIIGILSQLVRIQVYPTMTVTPSFNIRASKTRITCMMELRLGNVILAGLRIVKYWRGGLPKFKVNSKSKNKQVKA